MQKIKYFFITISLFGLSVFGQTSEYLFDYVTKENGLSSNNIYCIYEDSFGFIWFGTIDGLNRYDGINSVVYRNELRDSLSISNNTITCILEEPESGNLWVGTFEGLNYFDRGNQTFTRYLYDSTENSINNNRIYSLAFDTENTLWIGTNEGINSFKNGRFNNYVIEPQITSGEPDFKNYIKSILFDSTFMWLGTGEFMYKFDFINKKYLDYRSSPDLKDVRFINRDSNGNYWFSSYSNGLFLLKKGEDNIRNIKEIIGYPMRIKPQGIVEDVQGRIMLANRDIGLNIIDLENKKIQLLEPDPHAIQGLNSKALVYILKSKAGVIWLGTYNSGVNVYDARKKNFNLNKVTFKKDGLVNENIRALFQDSENEIWVGTKENGCLSKYNKKSETFTHYLPDLNNPDKLHGDYILSIAEMDKDHLLVGTLRQGINIFNKKTGKAKHIKDFPGNINTPTSNAVYTFWVKNKEEIWIGTMRGLAVWYPKENRYKQIDNIVNIRCIYNRNENEIWVGTLRDGIYVLDSKYNLIERYQHRFNDTTSLSSNEITSIKKDPNNRLWICTGGGGLNYYIPENNTFHSIVEEDGLANNRVCDILFHNKNEYWMSTGNGLSVYYPDKNEFKNYDKIDGLQGNEFADYVALKLSSGELIFGGRNGFNIFHPDNIKENTQAPKVVLTEFLVHNKPVKIGDNSPLKKSIELTEKITLTHKDFIFGIGFAALNYLSPEKNQYKYKLEGFEEEWIPVKEVPYVTYTNIPPGEYTFRVKASNNDGYWNEEGVSLDITILPPWWKTFWFRVGFVLFLGFITFYIFYNRFKSLSTRKKELELLVRKRTNELEKTVKELKETQSQLIQSEKMASLGLLTAGVAHEINNPLNFIQTGIYGLENIMEPGLKTDEVLGSFEKVIDGMKKGVNRVSNIVRTLNTFSRKSSSTMVRCDIHEIIDNCLIILNHEIKDKCKIIKNYPKKNLYIQANQDNLHQVFINLIMNSVQAIKNDDGIIEISTNVDEKEKQVCITISDNGEGISKKNMKKIYDPFFTTKEPGEGTGLGLSIVFNIICDHAGNINFESELNKGTHVKIYLPLN